jgi:hypothetical protein
MHLGVPRAIADDVGSEVSDTISLLRITEKFNEILGDYVSNGEVDYSALKRSRKALDELLHDFATLSDKSFKGLSEQEQIAFLINAYNAITLKVIVDNYPIQASLIKSIAFPRNSIRQISGAWDSIKHPLLGEQMTLNHIEHELLRKEYQQAGVHMALVCAAVSCPSLRSEAYVGARLEEQLKDQAREFLSNSSKFLLDKEKNRIYLSSIFDWFGEDFIAAYQNSELLKGANLRNYSAKEKAILAYVASHLTETDAAYIRERQPEIEYLKYDWTLNEKANDDS